MIRERFIVMTVMGVMLCGVVCGPARGQAQAEVLVFDSTTLTASAWDAVGELGYNRTRAFSEGGFEDLLRTKTWDLVVIEIPGDSLVQKTRVLALLESHVSAGGRLLVNYNDLDDWPELQKLMGVENAVSFILPKQRVDQANPVHASWGEGGFNYGFDPWDDSGDVLIPAPGSDGAALFSVGEVASVVGNGGSTIVNGFDWGSYQVTNSRVRYQIEYLTRCRADFDTSTGVAVLDIFDFLEFQNLFVQQHWKADLHFNGVFDIFDFLAFQDAFVNGCD